MNKQDNDGNTALILAAELGHSSCLNLVIQAGVNGNKCNHNKETALMFALTGGHSDCLAAFIKAGANVNMPIMTHETALSYALMIRNEDCIRLMIEAGADGHGSLLLNNLITKGKPGSLLEHENYWKIKALLRAGAKINNTRVNLLSLCLDSDRKRHKKKQIALSLFAAGEELRKRGHETPDYLRPPNRKTLKHRCRESIRRHLLKLNNVNLLYRVPRLGLPPTLSSYLLYEQSVTE